MNREIGGEYWLDNNIIFNESKENPEWINKFPNAILTASGRGALRAILNHIGLKNKKVLLPSYICESVIRIFEEFDYILIFYDLNIDLSPNIIDNFIKQKPGIFLHMGYFGFPSNSGLKRVITRLRHHSVIIVEDITQSIFSSNTDNLHNDFIFASIRKWFGIASGGLLSSKEKVDVNLLYYDDFVNLRISSLNKKFEYLNNGIESIKNTFLSGFLKAEKLLDDEKMTYKIDNLSQNIVNNLNYKNLIRSRRKNYDYLLSSLNDYDKIEIIFKSLADGVTPLFFPILVKSKRDLLQKELIKKRIYCPIHWPVPKTLQNRLSKNVEYIYDSILSIPCDQRYNTEDMNKIVIEIKKILNN